MGWFSTTIADDRGTQVTLLRLADTRDDPELGAMMRRFMESSSLMREKVRPVHVLLVVLFLAVFLGIVMLPVWMPATPPWLGGMVAPMFMSIGIFVSAQSRKRHSSRLAEGLLHIGRCPSCGYRLRGLVPEGDGAVVCPECAAAWERSRVGDATLPASDFAAVPEIAGDSPPVVSRWFRWVGRSPTILDDRGCPLPLASASTSGADHGRNEGQVSDIRRKVLAATRPVRVVVGGLVFCFGLLLALIFVMQLFSRGFRAMSVFSFFLSVWMCFIYTAFAWRIWSGRSLLTANRIRKVMLQNRVCASCAMPVNNAEVGPDQCTVCTRCHAVWKL